MKLISKAHLLTEKEEVEYRLQSIINWCTYDENTEGIDINIIMEYADEYAVSMKSCMQIAKSFRETLKLSRIYRTT